MNAITDKSTKQPRDQQTSTRTIRIAIYGGNGFVGTHVAKRLSDENVQVICLSRTGHKPIHLQDEVWSQQVCWSKGDASQPDKKILASTDCLICLVGSPPLPTFTKQAYEQQVFNNGTTNATAIKAAGDAGVKKLVLVSAKIPSFMQRESFGYAKGKNLALEAAKEFAQLSDQHSAIVFKPGGIYGKRYLRSGKAVPVHILLAPIAALLPSQLVSVDTLANKVAQVTLADDEYRGKLTVIENTQI